MTSCLCLLLQLLFVHDLEGIGCAVAIAIAIVLGHILCMNVYYYRRQKLDIKSFWIEILRMSVFPVLFCIISIIALYRLNLDYSWRTFVLETLAVVVLYLPLAYVFQMNNSEKEMIYRVIKKIYRR